MYNAKNKRLKKAILIFHVSDHPPDCKLIGTSHFFRRPVAKQRAEPKQIRCRDFAKTLYIGFVRPRDQSPTTRESAVHFLRDDFKKVTLRSDLRDSQPKKLGSVTVKLRRIPYREVVRLLVRSARERGRDDYLPSPFRDAGELLDGEQRLWNVLQHFREQDDVERVRRCGGVVDPAQECVFCSSDRDFLYSDTAFPPRKLSTRSRLPGNSCEK